MSGIIRFATDTEALVVYNCCCKMGRNKYLLLAKDRFGKIQLDEINSPRETPYAKIYKGGKVVSPVETFLTLFLSEGLSRR